MGSITFGPPVESAHCSGIARRWEALTPPCLPSRRRDAAEGTGDRKDRSCPRGMPKSKQPVSGGGGYANLCNHYLKCINHLHIAVHLSNHCGSCRITPKMVCLFRLGGLHVGPRAVDAKLATVEFRSCGCRCRTSSCSRRTTKVIF